MRYTILLAILLSSCSTAVDTAQMNTIKGTWTWMDVDTSQSKPVLKKHVLILNHHDFKEIFFEDGRSKGIQEGKMFLVQNQKNVQFILEANVQTVYKGVVQNNQLLISSINGKDIIPPALYKR